MFAGQLEKILRILREALDAGTERSPLADLSPPVAKPSVPRDAEDARRLDARQQVDLMRAWIEWAANLPRVAAEALHSWRIATRKMLEEARDLGIEARCVRLPSVALRSLLYSRVHVLHVVATPEAAGNFGKRLNETFGNAVPRRSIRVKRVEADATPSAKLLALADVD